MQWYSTQGELYSSKSLCISQVLSAWHLQLISIVNVFGNSIASGPEGNLQVAKKVVTTVGRIGDYIDEIQQSYELGFTPYSLHKNAHGTFVTPIRVYDGRVYVLDDETTMQVTTRQIATDGSKLIYFVKGDDDGGVGFALHGDRGPSEAKGLKGDSGDRGVAGRRGPTGKRDAAVPGGPPGKIGKVRPVGARGGAGASGDQRDKGDTGGVGQQGPRRYGSTGQSRSYWYSWIKVIRQQTLLLCKHLPMEMVEQCMPSICYQFDGDGRAA